MPNQKVIDESLKRDLSSFPVFGGAVRRFWRWLKAELETRGGVSGFYREYPAFLGQGILFFLIMTINEVAASGGSDLAMRVPGILFFAFDILNFNFLDEPYLLIFILMAFITAWVVNKLTIVIYPKLLHSIAALAATSLITGFVSFIVFGIFFSSLLLYIR